LGGWLTCQQHCNEFPEYARITFPMRSSEDVFPTFCLLQVFMEPLKKIQVEGFAMFAEPELLFGNLDELCCVSQ
jgi:hypothetical protein